MYHIETEEAREPLYRPLCWIRGHRRADLKFHSRKYNGVCERCGKLLSSDQEGDA